MMPAVPPPTRPEGCLSDLALDRLAAGELAGTAEELAAGTHLGGCDRCATRLAELQALPAHAPDAVFWASAAVNGPQPAPRRRARMVAVGAALVAVSGAVLVIGRPGSGPAELPVGDGTRTKGGLALAVHARRASDGQVAPIAAGGVLAPGDAIRFAVYAPGRGHLAILGLDAAQKVTVYAPAAPAAAMLPVDGAGWLEVDGSVTLDDTLGDEKLVAVFCPAPRPLGALHAAAGQALTRAGGQPARAAPFATGCQEDTLVFSKRPLREGP